MENSRSNFKLMLKNAITKSKENKPEQCDTSVGGKLYTAGSKGEINILKNDYPILKDITLEKEPGNYVLDPKNVFHPPSEKVDSRDAILSKEIQQKNCDSLVTGHLMGTELVTEVMIDNKTRDCSAVLLQVIDKLNKGKENMPVNEISSAGSEDGHESLHYSSDDSVKDPLFKNPTSSSSSSSDSSVYSSTGSSSEELEEEQVGDRDENIVIENEKRGKKREANTSGSIKAKAKRLRNAGKSYISNSKNNKKIVPEKKMDPPCTEKCKHRCYLTLTEDQRRNIFSAY